MRRLAVLLALLLAFALPATTLASTPIRLVINGTEAVTDVPPINEGGRVLVPVRVISETLGFNVIYDGASQTVTITKDEQKIVLYIGRGEALVNENTVPVDVPPLIRDGRTMIPIRFVTQNMGLQVNWDGATQTVTVTGPAAPPEEPTTPPEEPTTPPEEPTTPPEEPTTPPEEPTTPPEEPTTPPTEPASTDAEGLWKAMVEQINSDGLLTGTITFRTEGQEPFTLFMERYDKGSDFLSMTFIEFEGERGLMMAGARYQGQLWGASLLTPWSPVPSYKEEIDGLPTEDVGLDNAKVSVTEDSLDGVPMTKMTVVWADADEEGMDETTATYWLNQAGQMVRFEIEGVRVDQDGVKTDVRGVYTWQPWDEPIPWPPEIVGQ